MADFEKIKQDIIADIRPNGVGEITGQVMQDILLDMVDAQESVYNDVETAFNIVGGSIASLENRVAEHTQDIADANAHINEVENKADANTQDIAEVNLHIENIDDKVDANAQAIKDNASAITTLGGCVSANENRIEAITTEVVNQGEAISTLEGRVNNVEVNIEQLPIGIIEEQLEEIDSTLASHSEQIDNLQTDTAHNRSLILKAREDIDAIPEGYFPKMSVGFAENIVGDGQATEEEFSFRPTAGENRNTLNDGAARIEVLKGNSVVWNQLVDDTTTSLMLMSNHKYCTNINGTIAIQAPSIDTSISVTGGSDKVNDLTQMFGAGNEPTTVEEFYQRIPQGVDTSAYNEGEIINGNYEAIKTTGFNQFNGTYAKVLGGCRYYLGGTYTSIGYTTEEDGTTEAITISSDKYYTPVHNGYIYAEGEDICINLAWDEYSHLNGTYEPYKPFTRDLSWVSKYFPEGMRRAGSVSDEIRFNSTTQKWEAVQRIGVVDLGDLAWSRAGLDDLYQAEILDKRLAPSIGAQSNLLCDIYATAKITYASAENKPAYSVMESLSENKRLIYITDTSYTDAATFKAAMQGVMLYYELAEPIVTEITENVNFDYDVSDYGTEALLVAEGEQSARLVADIVYEPNVLATIKNIPTALSDIDMLQIKASQADGQISELQNEVEELSDVISKIAEDVGLYYGIEWDTTVADTAKTRIGDTLLHQSLPIQSNMRGCLLDDDGNVVEYLTPTDWSAHTLDGTKGQVMVEIPKHFRKFETKGTIRRCKISEYPLQGYHEVPKMYISAYEATVQRSTTTLASVMNDDADYRGGNNNADWDGTYRSLLGRPASFISRTNSRNYARKRKSSTTEWNCQDYNAYKAVFWLYMVEYANSNCQLAFNAEKDANGFAQGGLGNGVTTLSSSEWLGYNSYYPFVPCGHTNTLGNASGEVAYDVMLDDGSVLKTVYANRYRGIENPFGHIWKWADGINIQIEPDGTSDSSSKVYVADDTANYNDSNYDGYTMRGLEARADGYVRELVFGEFGDIMSAGVGGGSTTYWADHHSTKIPNAEALRGVLFGGPANGGAALGFACVGSASTPATTFATFGSRLCFIPNKIK